jgi:hypothetical protein
MHGCTKSRLELFEGTVGPYPLRATLKDPVLNAKVYTQQAMLALCCPTRLQQHLGSHTKDGRAANPHTSKNAITSCSHAVRGKLDTLVQQSLRTMDVTLQH